MQGGCKSCVKVLCFFWMCPVHQAALSGCESTTKSGEKITTLGITCPIMYHTFPPSVDLWLQLRYNVGGQCEAR